MLIDRPLSPRLVAPLNRLYQIRAVTLAEVFGKEYSQRTPDVEWIEYCGENNVVGLTANPTMYKVPHEADAIRSKNVRILSLKATPSRLESAMIVGQNIRLLQQAIDGSGALFVQVTSGPPTYRIRGAE